MRASACAAAVRASRMPKSFAVSSTFSRALSAPYSMLACEM